MKAFWADLFFDVNEGNSTKEEASAIAGESIRSTLIDIDNALSAKATLSDLSLNLDSLARKDLPGPVRWWTRPAGSWFLRRLVIFSMAGVRTP